MRIGILTQPLHTNYGGILQNYALQQILKRMGHSVTTIRHTNPEKSLLEQWKGWLKYTVLHFLSPGKYDKPSVVIDRRDKLAIRKNTDLFIEKHIDCAPAISSHEEFSALGKAGYDAFIVGSDQCWRYKYNKPFIYEMFLSFLPDDSSARRLAYAVSFGTDAWELDDEQTRVCSGLAKKFSAISVREDSGVKLCKEYLGVDSTRTLDPTLLLDRNDYLVLIKEESDEISQKTLFTYILDPNAGTSAFIDSAAKRTGLTPYNILPKRPDSLKTCCQPSPAKWLKSIYESEMTIVDSFHGMVFSILFNKPFWVIGNPARGMSRFTSLLKIFGLEDRLIQISDIDSIDILRSIDWSRVNQTLEMERSKSMGMLRKCLD